MEVLFFLLIYSFAWVLSYFVTLLVYLKLSLLSSQFANFKPWPLQVNAIFSSFTNSGHFKRALTNDNVVLFTSFCNVRGKRLLIKRKSR